MHTHARAAAAQLGDALQGVYARDKKARASETVKAGILETLGLLVEAAPQVGGGAFPPSLHCSTCLPCTPECLAALPFPNSRHNSWNTEDLHRQFIPGLA